MPPTFGRFLACLAGLLLANLGFVLLLLDLAPDGRGPQDLWEAACCVGVWLLFVGGFFTLMYVAEQFGIRSREERRE